MNNPNDPLPITAAIPAYAAPLRKRGSNVSRDPKAPRSRRALHGKGRQFLEVTEQREQSAKLAWPMPSRDGTRPIGQLRSEVCGTITSVQKDTLVWIEV